MSKDEARNIALRYLGELKRRHIPVNQAYLFGSQVRGGAHKGSDIDVAVVSPWFDSDDDDKRAILWVARTPEEYDIEPHGFSPEDFASNGDPMVYEIKKTGEKLL